MNVLTYMPTLLADRGEMLRELGGGFRGDRARVNLHEIALVLLAAAALMAAFWMLSKLAAWREERTVYHNPKQLFRKLAAAHTLSWRERWLLLQAARHVKIPFPACLFLRPDLFDAAGAHSQLAARADELVALKRKLFGQRPA